ncbi:MAG: Bro-N domain-containing protein [Bacteroidales bacterium]|nr:Bro-N domain-containing protein [Bacteroidales bacterium]
MTHGKNEAGILLPKVFTFNPANAPIRVQMINDEPWFVGKDVCEAISIVNHKDALGRLDDDERRGSAIPTPGGEQTITVVSESGLYNLIFQSRKPEAKAFRKWVTSEVLPSIRQTGRYELKQSVGRPRTTRGELVNADVLNLLWLIGESLNHGDQKNIALELGVSVQSVNRTLNGYNRSSRILMALYNRARQNREAFMLYHRPEYMTKQLLGEAELPVGNHMPAIKLTTKRGGTIGNQNARKKGGR